MNIYEQIHWILDEGRSQLKDDALYADNIAFSHSLGLKCDCVGWTKLELSHPRAGEILNKIEAYCNQQGRTARCYYTRRYEALESDWYELTSKSFKIDTVHRNEEVPALDKGALTLPTIKAYMETASGVKKWDQIHVPERFYKVCAAHAIPDIRFCWTKDVGRYRAEQYFSLWCDRVLPHMGTGLRIQKREPAAIQAAGGWLPRLNQVFHVIQQVDYPTCYLRSELPQSGFVCSQTEKTSGKAAVYRILLHRDVLEMLLAENAISPKDYRPALVVDTLPGDYCLESSVPPLCPTDHYITQSLRDYNALLAKPRPIRKATDKQALTALRLAKRQRKTDFTKALPKAAILPIPYAPLHPYLLISNGGILSDEYRLLSSKEMEMETRAFGQYLAAEELLTAPPAGIVIAKCINGDTVLLLEDASVIRFGHEEPEAIIQWPTLAQFFYDALVDN